MSTRIQIIFFLTISNLIFGQVKNTNEVIIASEKILENKVGEKLFKFYSLQKRSFIRIERKSGKIKWKKLKPNKKINGKFLSSQLQFYFQHPEFNFQTLKLTYIKLDENLKLANEPFTDFIPEYLKNPNAEKWLSEKQIDEIILLFKFKSSKIPVYKQLIFDSKKKSYYWEVTNILSKQPKMSEVEIIKILPTNGKIIEHFEEKQYYTY